jgi:hypothetical protein
LKNKNPQTVQNDEKQESGKIQDTRCVAQTEPAWFFSLTRRIAVWNGLSAGAPGAEMSP